MHLSRNQTVKIILGPAVQGLPDLAVQEVLKLTVLGDVGPALLHLHLMSRERRTWTLMRRMRRAKSILNYLNFLIRIIFRSWDCSVKEDFLQNHFHQELILNHSLLEFLHQGLLDQLRKKRRNRLKQQSKLQMRTRRK